MGSQEERQSLLFEQIEIGMPLEYAAILAGYSFEEIDELDDDPEIERMVKIGESRLMSRHLENINENSEKMPNLSTWLLDRKFSEHFGQSRTQTHRFDPKNFSVTLKGRSPDADERTDD